MTIRDAIPRALVVAALACFVVATWTLRLTLAPGDEGFYRLLVYMPITSAPAVLVWRNPEALRWLWIWSLAGWVATIGYALPGPPYEYGTKPANWHHVTIPLELGQSVVLYGLPLAALVLQALRTKSSTVIEARVRRIAVLATLLGAIAALFAHLPPQAEDKGTISAFAVVILAPGSLVAREPTNARPIAWTLWALICGAGCMLVDAFSLGVDWQWPVISSAIGVLLVLLIVGIPIALAIKSPALPAARVHDA